MREDIERINRKMQELLADLQQLPEKWLEAAQSEMFEGVRFDYKSFTGGYKSSPGGQNTVDPYQVLGLDKSASDEEVKSRYRERLRQFHPDTAGPGMEYHLQAVMAAYELIKRERGWE